MPSAVSLNNSDPDDYKHDNSRNENKSVPALTASNTFNYWHKTIALPPRSVSPETLLPSIPTLGWFVTPIRNSSNTTTDLPDQREFFTRLYWLSSIPYSSVRQLRVAGCGRDRIAPAFLFAGAQWVSRELEKPPFEYVFALSRFCEADVANCFTIKAPQTFKQRFNIVCEPPRYSQNRTMVWTMWNVTWWPIRDRGRLPKMLCTLTQSDVSKSLKRHELWVLYTTFANLVINSVGDEEASWWVKEVSLWGFQSSIQLD